MFENYPFPVVTLVNNASVADFLIHQVCICFLLHCVNEHDVIIMQSVQILYILVVHNASVSILHCCILCIAC